MTLRVIDLEGLKPTKEQPIIIKDGLNYCYNVIDIITVYDKQYPLCIPISFSDEKSSPFLMDQDHLDSCSLIGLKDRNKFYRWVIMYEHEVFVSHQYVSKEGYLTNGDLYRFHDVRMRIHDENDWVYSDGTKED